MQQLDIFDFMYDTYYLPNDRPVRIIEMFAGIGTQRMAFEKLGVPYEVIAIVEVDKFALLSYASIHTNYLKVRDTYFDGCELTKEEMVKTLQDKNVGYNFMTSKHSITERNNIEIVRDYYLADKLSKNLGDVSIVKGVDLPKDIDMLTYSFPCTDLSKAGKQKGLDDTRSGLVYQVFRIVEELIAIDNTPKTLVMENVIDLIQVKFIKEFQEMQIDLEHMKFSNYVHVMNAKDYGVAQNRDRVFMVSIFGEYNYVKPVPFKLEKKLKDYLETDVDETFYLSDTFIKENEEKGNGFRFTLNDLEKAIKENNYNAKHQQDMLQSSEGYCRTIPAGTHGSTPHMLKTVIFENDHIKIPEDTIKGYSEAQDGDGVYINRPHQKRGVVQKGMIQTLKTSGNDVGVVVSGENDKVYNPLKGKTNNGWHFEQEIYDDKGSVRAIKAGGGSGNTPKVIENNLRIRKLTPLECWRLMGIDDTDFYKAQQVTSNAQLYKQAGNAIVVDVFAELIKPMTRR